jgi:hypothetical protein
MKKNKIIGLISGVITYIVIILMFSGYGNLKNHKSINEFIMERFLERYNNGALSIDKFKKYMFVFEETKLSGDGVSKGGLFHPNYPPTDMGVTKSYSEESTMQLNANDWIKHGGYSADEPEAPASLRHFYDPTRPEYQRYLNDKVNAKLLGVIQKIVENPAIDDVEWALGSENPKLGLEQHTYTWINGKKWLSEALKETDKEKRKKLMAKAWRALGETLHMIADHGCPAHVRNDAHPSPIWNYNNLIGNPDPYEEYMAIIEDDNPEVFKTFKLGKPDQTLKNDLDKAKTVKQIADILAIYTNKNFFSNETISGINRSSYDVQPIAHPDWIYPSPKLTNMDYSKYYYSNSIASSNVLHCTDLGYIARIIPVRVTPYLDLECVKSQAKVLIPSIMEAGLQTMKLFIPALKVEITEAKTGKSLKGKITHTKDDEYTNQLVYNGPVTLKRIGSNFKEKEKIELQAKDGLFEKTNLVAESGDEFIAEIEFGGVYVKSEQVKPDDQVFSNTRISFSMRIDGAIEYSSSGYIDNNYSFNVSIGNNFGVIPLADPVKWSGNSYSMSCSHTWKKTDATENSNSTQSISGSVKTVAGVLYVSGSGSCNYSTSENSIDSYGRKVIIRKVGSYQFTFADIPDGRSDKTDFKKLYFTWDNGKPVTPALGTISKYEETTTTEIIDTKEKTSGKATMKSLDQTKYGWVHITFDL